MARPVAGHEGRFEILGARLQLNSWRCNFTADDLPTRTFESLGYDSGITGFKSAEITVKGYIDLDQTPHRTPPGFVVGAIIVGNIFLYVRKTGNRRYKFTSVRVLAIPVQDEAEGKAEYEVTMKSNGLWTYML